MDAHLARLISRRYKIHREYRAVCARAFRMCVRAHSETLLSSGPLKNPCRESMRPLSHVILTLWGPRRYTGFVPCYRRFPRLVKWSMNWIRQHVIHYKVYTSDLCWKQGKSVLTKDPAQNHGKRPFSQIFCNFEKCLLILKSPLEHKTHLSSRSGQKYWKIALPS